MALLVGKDENEARRLRRAAAAGTVRRVHAGLFTDDLSTPLQALVRRELYAVVAAVTPGTIISHRSALAGNHIHADQVFLTGTYRRDIKLPGLTLRVSEGPRPLASDIRIPTPLGVIWRSSDARALLENLVDSRGADPEHRRTLGATGVESWLDRMLRIDESKVGRIRDLAKQVAPELGLQSQHERLDGIIGALQGTRRVRLMTPQGIARSRGRPYDAARIDLFRSVAQHLNENPPLVPEEQLGIDRDLQAFLESYFSNYIEGTEFKLEEAHHIVVDGQPMKYRENDSHDIIATYNAVRESVARPVFPKDADAFLLQLKVWNGQVIFSRRAKRPGEFKTEPNRAGNTTFVDPPLVPGTLAKGFELICATASHSARAALTMFVVSEVHPFADGNGRTARLAMNLALSEAGLTRIIVPTAFRIDYIGALKALSGADHNVVPYEHMLQRAARFSRWLDYRSQPVCFKQLRDSHALEDTEEARLQFGTEFPPHGEVDVEGIEPDASPHLNEDEPEPPLVPER